jgi:hypothetical protein
VDLVLLLQSAGETPLISAGIARCRTSGAAVRVQLDLLHSNSKMAFISDDSLLVCHLSDCPADG